MSAGFGPPPDDFVCDVCIVGAGPVGIALALECEARGLRVLMLEDGGRSGTSLLGRRDRSEIGDPSKHEPLHRTTRSGFGGTSWIWSGDCVPFDELDFATRQHVAYSGWPLSHADVAPFYDRAATILGCSQRHTPAGLHLAEDVRCIPVSTSAQPQLARIHWDHFEQSQSIKLCLGCPVVALELADHGDRITGVVVATRHGRRTVRVPIAVLAAGGLKTTQLLLATQQRWPEHFGGRNGPLGRFYMGHLTGCVAAIKFNHAAAADRFRPRFVHGRTRTEWRLTIPPKRQQAERLFNTAFWPVAPLFYDPAHGDGTLSAAFLIFAIPKLGGLLMRGSPDHAYLGPRPRRFGAHLRNILRAPLQTGRGIARALLDEIRLQPSIGALAGANAGNIYALRYHAESEPSPGSRVMLGRGVDRLGRPRLNISLQFSDKDIQSVVRAHEVLDEELRSRGEGELLYLVDHAERSSSILEQAKDGYHQMGTTRMGLNENDSVVNSDCQVHGVENLFVASSSVFTTSSHANPTLLATALALRLAQHLAAERDRTTIRGAQRAGARDNPLRRG